MLRKGIAIKKIATFVLALGAASIIITALTQGPLNKELMQGSTNTKDLINALSGKIEVKDKQTFSSAAKFVYHRSKKCQEVETYPGLSNTIYGSDPGCTGRNELDPVDSPFEASGNDMEGKYGRIKFRIKQPILLQKGGNTWIEQNMLAAADEGIYQRIMPSCDPGTAAQLFPSTPLTNPKYRGTGKQYVFYFKKDVKDERIQGPWMKQKGDLDKKVYCSKKLSNYPPVENEFNDVDVGVKLCPGDEGFIQMNKGQKQKKGPHNKGESKESLLGGESHYPFIQITDVSNQNCEVDNSGSSGSIYQQELGYVSYSPASKEKQVFSMSNSDVFWDLTKSTSDNDIITWEVPPGNKKISFTLKFTKRGHLQINAGKEGTNSFTYFNTHVTGKDTVYIQKPNNYDDTEVDYKTGETYTFTIKQENGKRIMKIEQDNNELYSWSKEMDDFQQVKLEAWETWESSQGTVQATDAKVKIKNVEIQ